MTIDDEIGEPITEAELTERFEQLLATCRTLAEGFAEPVGETWPVLSATNLPIASEALASLGDDLLEHASVFLLMAAERLRTEQPA